MCEGWSGLEGWRGAGPLAAGVWGTHSLDRKVRRGAEQGGGGGRPVGLPGAVPERPGSHFPRGTPTHPCPPRAGGAQLVQLNNLPGVSRAGRGRFLPDGGGGRGGGEGAEGELGCGLRAGSAGPRSWAGCGLRRRACGPRRLYSCLISISLPRDPRLGTAWDPPRPAGWCGKAWHCRCWVPLWRRRPGPGLPRAEELGIGSTGFPRPRSPSWCLCLQS